MMFFLLTAAWPEPVDAAGSACQTRCRHYFGRRLVRQAKARAREEELHPALASRSMSDVAGRARCRRSSQRAVGSALRGKAATKTPHRSHHNATGD